MKQRGFSIYEAIAALVIVTLCVLALFKAVSTYNEKLREEGRAEIRAELATATAIAEKQARAEETRRQNERVQHEAEDAAKAAATAQALVDTKKHDAAVTASLAGLRKRVADKCGGHDQASLDTCLAAEREASSRYSGAFEQCRSKLIEVGSGLRRTLDAANSCVTAYESLSPPTLKATPTLTQPKVPDG